MEKFMKGATSLARNPLGIIALFIVMVYGIASLVATSDSLAAQDKSILIYFLAIFPCLVLVSFVYLVVSHSNKLYAPSDFKDEKNYIDAISVGSKEELEEKAVNFGKEVEKITGSIEGEIEVNIDPRTMVTMQYVNRWNSPDILESRKLLSHITKEKLISDKESRSAVISILNFLEELSIAINRSIADEELAKEFFQSIFVKMNAMFQSFIYERRNRSNSRDVYINFEGTAKKWEGVNKSSQQDASQAGASA